MIFYDFCSPTIYFKYNKFMSNATFCSKNFRSAENDSRKPCSSTSLGLRCRSSNKLEDPLKYPIQSSSTLASKTAGLSSYKTNSIPSLTSIQSGGNLGVENEQKLKKSSKRNPKEGLIYTHKVP